jgi:ABC-type branched-subunit amino acid transport system ATPase component
MSAILEVRDVTMRFGGLVANERVSMTVQSGEIFAVIGPNGAGKTTLFNAITGIYEATEGQILFEGKEIRREWSRGTSVRAYAVGIATAMVAVLALNATDLWQGAIVEKYTYAQPFPWGEAMGTLATTMRAAGFWSTWGPALIGFVLGRLGFGAIWRAQRRTPDLVSRAGVARTFQNIRLFAEMNLVENVLVGMDQHCRCGYWACLLRPPHFWREQRIMRARAFEHLKFVELADAAGSLARSLPYGHQRRLEIARALATEPKLILLDEPAAGMNPAESADLMRLIRRIRDRGTTVVLIEHDMKVVMGFSDRIVVLQHGKKIAEGTPDEIRNNPVCIAAYLGTEVVN